MSQLAQDEGPSIHPLARHPSLAKVISLNQSIPANSFCSIPDATVFMDTGEADRIYTRTVLTLQNLSSTRKSKHG